MPITLLREKPSRRFPLKKWPCTGLTAIASSEYSSTFTASKAIDGDMFISSTGKGWISAANKNIGEWIQINHNRKYTRKIVCIGDSITEGHPGHDNDPSIYGEADDPLWQYEAHLARMLPCWTIVNKGVGSDTTAGMVSRFATDVLNESPAYVIILGGVNDIATGVALSTIQNNLQTMYTNALNNGILPVACTLLPWNNGTSTQKDTIDSLNAWIRAYARDNQIPLVEFFKNMEDPLSPRNMPSSLHSDGVHPNKEGYRLMAEIIDPSIFERHQYLRTVFLSTRVEATPGSLMMPTKIKLEYGNLVQIETLPALASNNYEGYFAIDLADQRVTSLSVKITVLECIKYPGVSGTSDYVGIGEVELYF